MLKEVRNEFKMPGTEYRGAPFWSWNDLLEDGEIRRQIRLMKKAGMGGFFMHSRGGLETPFHGEEWFKIVDAAVDEATKQGMYAWAYDEDRWPSGPAGGLSHLVNADVAIWGLLPEKVEGHPAVTAGVLAVFKKKGKNRYEVAKPNDKGEMLAFREVTSAGSGWTNNRPPFNVLSAKAVDTFIDVAYRPYAERYKTAVKKGVLPGVFTDEPNYRPRTAGGLCWTKEVPGEFLKRRGYDIVPLLPALLPDGVSPDPKHPTDEVLHDYHQTLAELFEENFSKRIGEFCGKSGFALTGHYLCEQPVKVQVKVGGACMPHYIHEQVPGVDILCRRTDEIITVKQTASVCRQWGKKKLLSELYGASGWEFTFSDQKKIGDWQFALGVNFRCQHLALYSMRGERKRDYPPSIYIQQPWWPKHRLISDYFARLSLSLRAGAPLREVAVIHPIESFWASIHEGSQKVPDALDKALYELADKLLSSQVDFDFVDESLLERFGGTAGGKLKMNKVSYGIVVVPRLTHIRPSTVEKLIKFEASGGKLVSVIKGGVKVYAGKMDKKDAARLQKQFNALLAKCYIGALGKLVKEVKAECKEAVEIKGKSKFLYMLREDGKERLIFVTNQSEEPVGIKLEVTGGGKPAYWNLESGKTVPLAAEPAGKGRVSIPLSIPAIGSALISYEVGAKLDTPLPVRKTVQPKPVAVSLPAKADYKLTCPNVLYLDKAKIEVVDTGLALDGFVPQIGRSIKQVYNLPAGRYFETQPWLWEHRGTGKKVNLTYTFDVDKVPPGIVQLGLERLSNKQVFFNGKAVKARRKGFFLDKAIDVIELPKLRQGKNTITFVENLDDRFEAEAIYVLGCFGVDKYRITSLPEKISTSDWSKTGLPFYAGGVRVDIPVTVKKAGEYKVEIDAQGTVITGAGVAGVDGGNVEYRGFPPFAYTVDLSKGKNVIAVEMVNSLRNLMGPHHAAQERPMWCGPGEMAPENPVDRYVHIPSGITAMRISESVL